MLRTKIVLIDQRAALVSAWKRAFAEYEQVEAIEGDFFSRPADAMVSPANSFGIMDGGLDRAIRDHLGFAVERAAQRSILEHHHGELPVGQAVIVESGHAHWPSLIVAPTMRVPENVSRTLNAYLAFRAVLLAVSHHNAVSSRTIASIVCPGLGTGIGAMEPERCAVQMRMAYRQVAGPARIPSFDQIHAIHGALLSA
jgi:O-acetyl-ADP-ribose deacetylase (regulator of RNase III)